MNNKAFAAITGTGCYIPPRVVKNNAFLSHSFYDENGEPYKRSNKEIIQKFETITGIQERRYAADDMLASDMAAEAGEAALQQSDIDRETLHYLIVAHNFGDIRADNLKVDMLPSLASRVKKKLGISSPNCIAYDLAFGCPGWLQAMIQSNCFITNGPSISALIIGSETLSRVCDPHDRDSMIYSDGAGATLLERRTSDDESAGILSSAARTDTDIQAYYLTMDTTSCPNTDSDTLYLKMEGRKLYQYALSHVPSVIKKSLDRAHLHIDDVAKVFIHQANAKMDRAILDRLLNLYERTDCPDNFMPMTISWLGNSSVATIPTLLDLVSRGKMEQHAIAPGDILVFASVGAGMNINSVVYKVPE